MSESRRFYGYRRRATAFVPISVELNQAVVYELDPTIIRTANLSVNPFRVIARQVTLDGPYLASSWHHYHYPKASPKGWRRWGLWIRACPLWGKP